MRMQGAWSRRTAAMHAVVTSLLAATQACTDNRGARCPPWVLTRQPSGQP
jgi:hypothetical protein